MTEVIESIKLSRNELRVTMLVTKYGGLVFYKPVYDFSMFQIKWSCLVSGFGIKNENYLNTTHRSIIDTA